MNALSRRVEERTYSDWKGWKAEDFGIATPSERQYFAAQFRRAGIRIGAGASILEIGFGNGALLAYLDDKGVDVWGTEANDELVERAIARGYCVSADKALCAFSHRRFDAIVALDVLEHIPESELPALLARIAGMLAPGGRFLARFPNGDSPLGLWVQNGDTTHRSFIGSAKARFLFETAGLRVNHIGAPARPLLDRDVRRLIYNLAVLPLRVIIEKAIKLLFFPGSDIHFFSSNLIVVGRQGQAGNSRK